MDNKNLDVGKRNSFADPLVGFKADNIIDIGFDFHWNCLIYEVEDLIAASSFQHQ